MKAFNDYEHDYERYLIIWVLERISKPDKYAERYQLIPNFIATLENVEQ